MMSLQRRRSKVLLIGDSCYDYYHYGDVDRISPEAPVPIFDSIFSEKKLGMASNVRENFLALNVDVILTTAFCENKHRYIHSKSGKQLLRVDEKLEYSKYEFASHGTGIDAVVISDYDKGYLDYEDIEKIIKEATVPVFIDTKKKDLNRFKGATLKLNQLEWDSRISDHDDCIITSGSDDINYRGERYHVPKVDAHDVCGAGDTFLAAYVYSEDMDFAIRASSITVQKIGVYAPALKEIEECV